MFVFEDLAGFKDLFAEDSMFFVDVGGDAAEFVAEEGVVVDHEFVFELLYFG